VGYIWILMLKRLGNFPNPPIIIIDIIIKKIITNACLVIIVLDSWSLINDPHVPNSNRMIILIHEPNISAQKGSKIKYTDIFMISWIESFRHS